MIRLIYRLTNPTIKTEVERRVVNEELVLHLLKIFPNEIVEAIAKELMWIQDYRDVVLHTYQMHIEMQEFFLLNQMIPDVHHD